MGSNNHYQEGIDKALTTLAPDIEFDGELEFGKSLAIMGNFRGKIKGEDLYIGREANIKADISVDKVVCEGTVEGNISGNREVILKSSAVVIGDITTPLITIESGSVFNGRCIMQVKN